MPRRAYYLLLVLGGISLVVSVVSAFTISHPFGLFIAHGWVWGVAVPSYLVGAFAIWVRPDHLSARWLGAVGSLVAIETAARRLLPLADDMEVEWWVAGSVFLQAATLATTAAIASLLVVFPDDELRYRYQGRVLWGIWLGAAALPLALLVSEPSLFFPPSWFGPEVSNPLFVSALASLGAVAEEAFQWRVVLWATGAVAMLVRYRWATPRARRQFVWPLMAALLLVGFDVFYRTRHALVPSGTAYQLLFGGWVPGLGLLSFSILVALLRHRLIGVDLWLRRSVLFGGASVVITLAYLGLAGLVGVAAGERISLGVGVLVTLAVVVGFHPARRRLDAWARRWVFGSSATGTEVLRRVGDTLEDAYDIPQIGANLLRTMVDGLDLEWARMSLSSNGDGPTDPVAAVGVGKDVAAAPDLVAPLIHLGETVGFLECGPKRQGELTTADEELVTTVARQAALAVSNARLAIELESRLEELNRQAAELAASRARIVQAQMEERHRIERNIHDGVQQEIIASMAKVRLARNQLARDPRLAEVTLAEFHDDARRTLENLRELSRGIHPSVLTHQGLVEALHTKASLLPIDVQVEMAPDVCDARFPDAIEEAAYYVVSEGLANVLKHAATEKATVRLHTANGHLTVEVIDEGRGCRPGGSAGSGIVGLRDRLGSIGGNLTLESASGDGTTLRAVLPVRVAGNHV